MTPDHTTVYDNPLPGPDFNRQVYHFNDDVPIWTQSEYEHRVRNEADILVALEALKQNILYLGQDVMTVKGETEGQIAKIIANDMKARENRQEIDNLTIPVALAGLSGLQNKCRECEYFIT